MRRLALEPLEDRRLLASLVTLGGTATPAAVDPGGTTSVAVQLAAVPDPTAVSSSLKGFSLGIFLNADDLGQVAWADFSSDRGITVSASDPEEYLPDISIANIYPTGYQNGVFLSRDTGNLDGNTATDWYLRITWVDLSSNWVSGNVSRTLANLNLTLKDEFGQMAATVPVDYRWLDRATNAPSWNVQASATEIFVNGQLPPPVISSVTATNANRFDQATVTYSRVTGADSYLVEYSTSDRFPVQTTKSKIVSDTSAVIEGLLPNTNYYFRVTAQSAESEYNSIASSNKAFTTAAVQPDLAISAATFPAKVVYGESFAISGLTVTNKGNGPVDKYTVSFIASSDDSFATTSDNIVLGSVTGGPLDFNAKAAVLANLSTTNLLSGERYYLIWTVTQPQDASPADNTFVSATTILIEKIPIAAPVLSIQSPKIGDTLTASFADTAITASLQWLRYDSVSKTWNAIENATSASYSVTTDDFASFLRVEATGIGNYSGTKQTGTDKVVDVLTAVSLSSDSPTVGTALSLRFSAKYTTVSPQDAEKFSYIWRVNNTVVSQAATYTPTASDVGKMISVEVSSTDTWTGIVSSSASKVVMWKLTGAALSSELPMVGDTLEAVLEQTEAFVNYQWYRVDSNDIESKINDEISSKYTAESADAGSRLRLKITADESKYWTGEIVLTTSAVIALVSIQANPTVLLGCDLYLATISENAEITASNWTYLWDLDGDGAFETERTAPFLASSLLMGGVGNRTLNMKIRDEQSHESAVLSYNVSVIEAPQTVSYSYDVNDQVVRLSVQENSFGAAQVLGWNIDWGDESIDTFDSVSRTLKAVHYYQTLNVTNTVRVGLLNEHRTTTWYDLFSCTFPANPLSLSYLSPSAIAPKTNEQAAPILSVSPMILEPPQPAALIAFDDIFAAWNTDTDPSDTDIYDTYDALTSEWNPVLLSDMLAKTPQFDHNAEQNSSSLNNSRPRIAPPSQSNTDDANLAINITTELSLYDK